MGFKGVVFDPVRLCVGFNDGGIRVLFSEKNQAIAPFRIALTFGVRMVTFLVLMIFGLFVGSIGAGYINSLFS